MAPKSVKKPEIMTQRTRPICFECAHFYIETSTCEAFQNQIPREILDGENFHDKPLPGQKNDLVFEPRAPLLCSTCKWHKRGKTCFAFNSIPEVIINGSNQHDKLMAGQTGNFIYEKIVKPNI